MSEFFTYVRGLVTPSGQGFPSPLFLGVAIGLELRIRLWHMFWLAFVAVEVFAYVSLRKLFLPFRLFFHCADVLSCDFFGSLAPRVFPSSLSLPSEGRDGGGRSRDALVLLPAGFPLDLVQREGWRSLWSCVRCTWARFCLLGSFVDWGSRSCSLAADSCYLFCPRWLSLLISARSARWWGGRVFGAFFLCSQLPLPPHLCTLGEVVRRARLPSAVPVRVPHWPSDLRLARPGGYLSPLLVGWLSCAVLLLTLSLRLPYLVRQSRRCGRGLSR